MGFSIEKIEFNIVALRGEISDLLDVYIPQDSTKIYNMVKEIGEMGKVEDFEERREKRGKISSQIQKMLVDNKLSESVIKKITDQIIIYGGLCQYVATERKKIV